MPKISKAFQTITIKLPSYEDSEVVIKTHASVEDIMEVEKVEGEINKSILMIKKMILRWNFQDDNGTDLPVGEESIRQLPTTDLEFLLETVAPYIQKKTLSEKTS